MAKRLRIKKIGALILACAFALSVCPPASASVSSRQNTYPIVLCHGNGGWGRDEMLGYKYWGGVDDLQKKMTDAGYTTYTAAVGPYSSNWDRACELYAYIKGGTVDYGKAHSEEYGHARYGKTYPGLYTSWGNQVDGKINKIHLVGHSQGGQTTRVLIQLLEQGSAEEKTASPSDVSPLFTGGKAWVASLTTLVSPHDGTTVSDFNTDELKQYAKQAIASVGAAAGLGYNLVFDFKLDQWGLKRNAGECYIDYADRVWNSSVWDQSNLDFSFYDLSTDGAAVENGWVKAAPDVYYFSYAACATMENPITEYQIPNPLYMNTLFSANSIILGRFQRSEGGRAVIDSSWWPNDGWVNTISEDGPKLNSTDEIVDYDGTAQIGKWNFIGTMQNMDHEDIIGRFGNAESRFMEIARRAGNLPVVD
nr:lipase [uncultured Caproiciproducens sp.]